MASSSGELSSLKALEKEIESALPVDPIQKLKQDLSKAIQDERYEEAAHLRDQLRRMEGEGENR
jgi:protein-arginine kinase activator protein McsA